MLSADRPCSPRIGRAQRRTPVLSADRPYSPRIGRAPRGSAVLSPAHRCSPECASPLRHTPFLRAAGAAAPRAARQQGGRKILGAARRCAASPALLQRRARSRNAGAPSAGARGRLRAVSPRSRERSTEHDPNAFSSGRFPSCRYGCGRYPTSTPPNSKFIDYDACKAICHRHTPGRGDERGTMGARPAGGAAVVSGSVALFSASTRRSCTDREGRQPWRRPSRISFTCS